ncbi:retrovirus-related Pol polyprotein from transposon 412 [Trichonephila clavipes]|nr:retrovirus-related Pol polyprotein from transposon 412 [Trichonephila clavipes]
MTISDGSPTFDIGPNVSQHNRAEVEQLLSTYTPKKTKTVNIDLDIALTDDEPIFHKPQRLPFAERDIVDAQVEEWIKNGIVQPCSSPYASQVVVVKKKDGKSRVCIDYRRLNRKLIKDNYPLPLIDVILDCLQNAKIFTTLDLKNGFFHVAVNERSRKFTSFVTHNGQYQFRRMPFGLSTCPSTFMRYINAIFRHLISKRTSFKIITDCDALVKTLSKKELNPSIARWVLYLQEFNYTIEHGTGSKVDALSRRPHCMLIQYSVQLQFLKAQQADDQITAIKTLLETTPQDNYIVKNKLLYKTVNGTDLLVVPDEMLASIIKTAHERGHFAVLRTQDLVSKDFYIPRLKDKVEKCFQNCVTCILTNWKRGKQDGTLNPIEKKTIYHSIHFI